VDGANVAEAQLVTSEEHDGIAVADLSADHSLAGQAFEVEAGGIRRSGTFAPAEDTPSAFSFLIGSCNQPYVYNNEGRAELGPANDIYTPMVGVLEREKVNFALLVGDQTYADGVENISVPALVREHPEMSNADILEMYRHQHRLYLGQSGFSQVLAKVPTYLVWDDHEIFDCWGSHTDLEEIDKRLYRAAETAYAEYEHAHNPGATLGQDAPFHYRFWHGDAGFFVLDLRSERDYSEGLLIGEDQWQSLRSFLDEAAQRGTRTVFIASSIPVVHFSPGLAYLTSYIPNRKASLSRDRWDSAALAPHRRRLLSMLFGWQTQGDARKVVILSGDVHSAAAFRVREKGGRGVISQWTSSAFCTPTTLAHRLINDVGTVLTNLGDGECNSKRIGLEARNNFGIVKVTPAGSDAGHSVRFDVYGYDHGTHATRLSFSDLL
jgi:alkaline phosphatase D